MAQSSKVLSRFHNKQQTGGQEKYGQNSKVMLLAAAGDLLLYHVTLNIFNSKIYFNRDHANVYNKLCYQPTFHKKYIKNHLRNANLCNVFLTFNCKKQ